MIRHLDLNATCRAALLALLMAPAGSALGAMTLPGGDLWLNGDFDEINYGLTGLAYVKPFLFVGDLAATDKPSSVAAETNLDYGYQFSGLGTPMLTVTYSITNNDAAAFNDLRFMVDVQADGSGSFNDVATVVWPAQGMGGPDHYQVVDWAFDDLPTEIIANNGLNDTDACGGAVCDVDFGLQWNLASIAPGEIWQIVIGLSDDGSTLSNRFLQATSWDTTSTELTFSGNASVIPLPAAAWLFGSGLLGLVMVARRKVCA